MKINILILFLLFYHIGYSQTYYPAPLGDYIHNGLGIKLNKLTKECSKEKINYSTLSAMYKEEVDKFPERVIKYYKDSLNTIFGDDNIEKTWLLNYKSYTQDRYYQTAALANSNGISYKEQDSLSICSLCTFLIKPDDDSPFLLDEDKPLKYDNTITTINSNTLSQTTMILDRDLWLDYTTYVWVKTSYNSSNKSSIWIEAPLGTQICDIDYNVSGRGNKKVEFSVRVPDFINDNLVKHTKLRITANAYGDNELLDRKSAKCRVDIKRVRLIPFHFTLTDRERLGCRTLGEIIRSIPPENYIKYLKEPDFYLTVTDLENLPKNYPNE